MSACSGNLTKPEIRVANLQCFEDNLIVYDDVVDLHISGSFTLSVCIPIC